MQAGFMVEADIGATAMPDGTAHNFHRPEEGMGLHVLEEIVVFREGREGTEGCLVHAAAHVEPFIRMPSAS